MMAPATGILPRLLRVSTETDFDENSVTPGVVGFIAIFLIAAITILLLIDMTRRIRRTRYRGEIKERLDAEEAAAAGMPGSDRPTDAGRESSPDTPRDPSR